jgi:hypothetical protein
MINALARARAEAKDHDKKSGNIRSKKIAAARGDRTGSSGLNKIAYFRNISIKTAKRRETEVSAIAKLRGC